MILDKSQFLTVDQAAKAFGISRSALRHSIHYGKPKLPGLTRMPNGQMAFFKSVLIQHAKDMGWVLILDEDEHEKRKEA